MQYNKYRGKRFIKKKYCKFCSDKVPFIDYKDVRVLKNYISERGKITPGKMSGTCARHQRELATSIKRSRNIALLPFVEK